LGADAAHPRFEDEAQHAYSMGPRHEGLHGSRPALEELALGLDDVGDQGDERDHVARCLEHDGDQRIEIAQLQVVQQTLEHREGQAGIRVEQRQEQLPSRLDVLAVSAAQRL